MPNGIEMDFFFLKIFECADEKSSTCILGESYKEILNSKFRV